MQDDELTARLDALRRDRPAAPAGLRHRATADLPPQDPMQNLLDWFAVAPWRGAVAALLPLALGFVLGLNQAAPGGDAWFDSQALVFADALEEYELDEI